MSEGHDGIPPVPESRAVPRRRTRISAVWVIPIVAAIAGGWVAVTRILSEGPEITVVFESAVGLEAGKTKVEYNGVKVGTVTDIQLAKDRKDVVASVQMEPDTRDLLAEDTQFWVVRPRITGASVTGLGTLVSGAYIDMKLGKSGTSGRHFRALTSPPVLQGDKPGRMFSLHAANLGSVDLDTPVYFRRLKVGEIVSYELEPDGQSFLIKAFVYAPYHHFVTADARFWHASGIDLSLSASGLSVQTQSILSVLVGGVAFETPTNSSDTQPAADGADFKLFKDRSEAFAPAARDPQTYVVVFDEAVRGLSPGAPVDFRGITTGEVVDVTGRLDEETFEFTVWVTLNMDAQKFGVQVSDGDSAGDTRALRRHIVDSLVARGVRAQLRTGSLLTGALYVALDVFPDAAPAKVDWAHSPPRLPTIPGQIQEIESGLASVIKKIDKIPFDAIGQDLDKVILELDRTLVSARAAIDSANSLIEPNSVLGEQLDDTLQEVSGAARSVRGLADYLDRHPEALLRGKKGGAK